MKIILLSLLLTSCVSVRKYTAVIVKDTNINLSAQIPRFPHKRPKKDILFQKVSYQDEQRLKNFWTSLGYRW